MTADSLALSIGDHVVHPAHGLGEVIAIEDRVVAGRTLTYLTITVGDLRVMVPAADLDEFGIREPASKSDAEAILALLADDPIKDPGHRGRRSRNDQRIRSGQAKELARVVRSLLALSSEGEKGLKHHDMAHLREAMDRLVAELAITWGVDEAEARRQVLDAVGEDAPRLVAV